jgi:hypothetical protein
MFKRLGGECPGLESKQPGPRTLLAFLIQASSQDFLLYAGRITRRRFPTGTHVQFVKFQVWFEHGYSSCDLLCEHPIMQSTKIFADRIHGSHMDLSRYEAFLFGSFSRDIAHGIYDHAVARVPGPLIRARTIARDEVREILMGSHSIE